MNQTSPELLNQQRFRVRGLFIVSILFRQQQPDNYSGSLIAAADQWLKTTFASSNFFSGIIHTTENWVIQTFEHHFRDFQVGAELDLANLYETLLGIETGEEQQKDKFTSVKHYRNKLGSYYTPKELAFQVTQNTIETYLKNNQPTKNKISKLVFADFSCGVGNFLIEIIRFFGTWANQHGYHADQKSALLKEIVKNIYAIDVDCIALEVAKINVLLESGQTNAYLDITHNYYHANFLLQSSWPVEEENKQNLFASGYIYHQGLALDKNKLRIYDIILGNPPWEKIRFEEKKFAANSLPIDFKSQLELAKKALKKDSFFDLSNSGELNTYALFTEAAARLKTTDGIAGLVLKSGLVTSQVNKKLFRKFVKEQQIIAIYDFINRQKIFDIDSRERFCFLLLGTSAEQTFKVAMNLTKPEEINTNCIMVELSAQDLERLNPLSGMLPNFSNAEEAAFLLRMAHSLPSFNKVHDVKFGRIVHLNTHASDITKVTYPDSLAIYEGKFFNQFNGKFAGFNGMSSQQKYGSKVAAVPLNGEMPESRFFINREKWLDLSKNHNQPFMLAWRSLTSATNTRTCIATILPFIPAIQSVQFLTTAAENLLYLCGLYNSVVFDYVLKKKLSGIDLTQSVINQMPVPSPNAFLMVKDTIDQLVYSLLCTDKRLDPLFEQLDIKKPVPGSRYELLKKLDLEFIQLYQLSAEEVKLVVREFPKQYGQADEAWFLENLSNNAISTTSTMSAAGPVN